MDIELNIIRLGTIINQKYNEMLIYFAIFIFILVFAILENKLTTKSKSIAFFGIGLLMILLAGLRDSMVDFDYSSYKIIFNNTPKINILISDIKQFFSSVKIEPSLLIIFAFTKSYLTNGFQIAIFFYALISVLLKLKAIHKLSDFAIYSLLIYFSGIYLLQDMTQIRAAVAVGLILLSIPKIEEKKYTHFFIYILIAVLFHYSSIIFIAFIFLNTKKIDKTYYLLLILIPLFLSVLDFNLVSFISKMNLGIISDKINQYIAYQKSMKLEINLFNFNILIQIAISIFFIFFSEKTNNKYAIILTKINCYGVALFYLFSTIPVIAFRSNELLSSVQIILIPFLIYIIKPKALAEGIVILIAALLLINQLLINPIIKEYTSIIFQ